MKRTSFALVVLIGAAVGRPALAAGPAPAAVAVSPDCRNEIRLYAAPLGVEVLRDGRTVVGRSSIGLTLDGAPLVPGAGAPSVTDRSGTGRLATPVYKKAFVDLARTEKFADFGGWGVGLVARNDGVAYRFETRRPGTVTVDGERADLALPADAQALVYKTDQFGSEEKVPEILPLGAVTNGPKEKIYLPLAYVTGGTTVAVTESDVCDYPCWYLRKGERKKEEGKSEKWDGGFSSAFSPWPKKTHHTGLDDNVAIVGRGRREMIDASETFLVKTSGTRTFPWRAFVLADAPSKLCESDLVFALARPSEGDFSWVKPGLVVWDWWSHFCNAPASAPNGGCTTRVYETFIDFAAKHRIPYVIVDSGWSDPLDIWKFHPLVDIPYLLDYAAKRQVGLILWIPWTQAVGDELRVAAHFAKLGAKGFKVDFMDRADAKVERFLHDFAAACAKHRLVVDYHGAHRPTGMSRTYPNVLNYEGVHGLECLKWEGFGDGMMGSDVAAFFARLTAGPMDYTPGAMDNYPIGGYPKDDKAKGVDVFCNPGSVGTRCRQMAMMTLYEAPLQMLSDAPAKYDRNEECFRFMARTPTVWADTVGLGGTFDTYAACAREAKDGRWFAAAVNNATGRVVTVGTDFLGTGAWTLEIFRDAADAAVRPKHYLHETKTVTAGTRLEIPLAPGGGFSAVFAPVPAAARGGVLELPLLPGEKWWGGAGGSGESQPYGAADTPQYDLNIAGNTSAPLLVSTAGRFLWSEKPFVYQFTNGTLRVEYADGLPAVTETHGSLKDAYLHAAQRHFRFDGTMPPEIFFTKPQWNNWIEIFLNGRTQRVAEDYAAEIVSNNFPCGVYMVDGGWFSYMGSFEFERKNFPDPKRLFDRLNGYGWTPLVWTAHFVSPDSPEYMHLRWFPELGCRDYLAYRTEPGKEAGVVYWWDGISCIYDFTDPAARAYYVKRHRDFAAQYGIRGFKFDAGDPHRITGKVRLADPTAEGVDYARLYAEIAAREFPYNETRVSWKGGGLPLVTRLNDRAHTWAAQRTVIPQIVTAGLLGCPYAVGDMVGGGLDMSYVGRSVDEKLFVRSAALHALMPMMQFSLAPWRHLSPAGVDLARRFTALRATYMPYILATAREAARTGAPIVRPMEYEFPKETFTRSTRQFLLGAKLLVAPVLEADDSTVVELPAGRWRDDLGVEHVGPKTLKLTNVPLDRLPRYERL